MSSSGSAIIGIRASMASAVIFVLLVGAVRFIKQPFGGGTGGR